MSARRHGSMARAETHSKGQDNRITLSVGSTMMREGNALRARAKHLQRPGPSPAWHCRTKPKRSLA
eukprot:6129047-Pyramimonas_sp.AAC.1